MEKEKSVEVTVISSFILIYGLLFLLLSRFWGFIEYFLFGVNSSLHIITTLAFFIGLVYLISGVNILRFKDWARRIAIFNSFTVLFLCGLIFLFYKVHTSQIDTRELWILYPPFLGKGNFLLSITTGTFEYRLLMALFFLFITLIPLLFLIFLNLPKIKNSLKEEEEKIEEKHLLALNRGLFNVKVTGIIMLIYGLWFWAHILFQYLFTGMTGNALLGEPRWYQLYEEVCSKGFFLAVFPVLAYALSFILGALAYRISFGLDFLTGILFFTFLALPLLFYLIICIGMIRLENWARLIALYIFGLISIILVFALLYALLHHLDLVGLVYCIPFLPCLYFFFYYIRPDIKKQFKY